jgi:hypothetical protein
MSRIIEIRPYRNGWQCFEGVGVEPYWVGKDAKQQALSYGTERAKSDGSEIRVLNEAGEVVDTLRFNQVAGA